MFPGSFHLYLDQVCQHPMVSLGKFQRAKSQSSSLTTSGDQHRKQRKLLNPVFSGHFIRNLTPLFYEVAHKVTPPAATLSSHSLILIQMRESIQAELDGAEKEMNMFTWIHRAALEALGRGGLGCSLDPVNAKSSSNEYGEALKAVS